jgi:hypothetical protein
VTACAAALFLTGCVTPATGDGTYVAKARMSIEAAASEVSTARITVEALRDDRIFVTTADETVTASENALGSIADAFGSVQPPAGQEDLRVTTTTLLSDAEDALASARIAVRGDSRLDLPTIAAQLEQVAKDLDAQSGTS